MCILLSLLLSVVAAPQSVRNLLVDPAADAGGAGWTTSRDGAATVEFVGGNPCFVVRYNGSFRQHVTIPAVAPGTHVAVVGRASAERVNRDGSITGRPYLYGLIGTDGGRILSYLQGQGMRSDAVTPNQWNVVWGVFPVPEGATGITLEMKLAERRGDPQNGSVGRFDDVWMVLLPSEREALQFVETYKGRQARSPD
jgi:hypothetical protein